MNNKLSFIPKRSLRPYIGSARLTGTKALILWQLLGPITLLRRKGSSAYVGVAQWPKNSGSPPVFVADFIPAKDLRALYTRITRQRIKKLGRRKQKVLRTHYNNQRLEIVFLYQRSGSSIVGGMAYPI